MNENILRAAGNFNAQRTNSDEVTIQNEKAGTIHSPKNEDGHTPLHLAVLQNRLDTVKSIVEEKADINAQDNCGYTSLHYAVFKGNSEIATFLLEHKINIDIQDERCWTPLHYAICSIPNKDSSKMNIAMKIVALLLSYGAATNKGNIIRETQKDILEKKLNSLSIVGENSRLNEELVQSEKNTLMQVIFHNPENATLKEQLQVVAEMFEHPNLAHWLLSSGQMVKNARKRQNTISCCQ